MTSTYSGILLSLTNDNQTMSSENHARSVQFQHNLGIFHGGDFVNKIVILSDTIEPNDIIKFKVTHRMRITDPTIIECKVKEITYNFYEIELPGILNIKDYNFECVNLLFADVWCDLIFVDHDQFIYPKNQMILNESHFKRLEESILDINQIGFLNTNLNHVTHLSWKNIDNHKPIEVTGSGMSIFLIKDLKTRVAMRIISGGTDQYYIGYSCNFTRINDFINEQINTVYDNKWIEFIENH